MNTTPHAPMTTLARGQLMRIDHGTGQEIAVFGGRLWITRSDDFRDFFVRGGETFEVGGSGTTIVEALSDAKLMVLPAARSSAVPSAAPRVASAVAWSAALALLSGLVLVTYGTQHARHITGAGIAAWEQLQAVDGPAPASRSSPTQGRSAG